MRKPRLVLVGERDLGKAAHQGIEASLALDGRDSGCKLDFDWADTASITSDTVTDIFRDATGVWCTPGSPYESESGALLAIRFARTEKKQFLGTCGEFQHGLMEYFQNALPRPAKHQESTPDAESPLIVKLSCSLVGAKGKVIVSQADRFSDILGAREFVEEFNCNYGVDGALASSCQGSDLEFVAHDENSEIRAFRLAEHPFFIGTLFQPERRALAGSLHPVVRAFSERRLSVAPKRARKSGSA